MLKIRQLFTRASTVFTFRYHHQFQSTVRRNQVSWRLLWIPTSAFILGQNLLSRKVYATEILKDHLEDFIEKADILYSNNKPSELYHFLKNCKFMDNVEVLWRLSRAARDYATKDATVAKNHKKELQYEAFEYAKRALELNSDHFASHKWYAITIGDIGDYEGIKTKISNAFTIREHLERAIELNPNDATTIFCLGMWCYTFADMPSWQHRIASFVFATPPSSTYREAAEYFLKAERADPNFYSTNLLMLGKAYTKLGNTRFALMYLDRAIKYPAVTDEDKENKIEAQKLIDDIVKKNK